MKPGREMDALVAEKVMGLRVVDDPVSHRGVSVGEAGALGTDLWPYSTDDGAALTVMEALSKSAMGWDFTIHYRAPADIDIYASAGDCNCPHNKEYDPKDTHGYSSEQVECEKVESLAHALCLVALRCVKAIPRAHCILCSPECPCTGQDCGKDCQKCIPACKERAPQKG